MRIAIVEKPEPLSSASAREEPILIDSDARRLLAHELRRYCSGEVTGRSFLIAGHRGSGKTTLVQDVLQKELESQIRQPEEQGAPRRLRPLLVVLQGPNLLPTAPEEIAAAPAAAGEAKQPGAPWQPNEMENVLIQITLGLYRSMAKEFTRMYRLATSPNLQDERYLFHVRSRSRFEREMHLRREATELAAQLELDLDQYPGNLKLREYWRRGGFLERGLLFPSDPKMDQGIRELVALSSVCEIYRRICGTISRQEKGSSDWSRKAEAQLAGDARGSDYLKPLIAMLTGGVAGGGVLAASPGATVTAALTGLVSALGAAAVFKYSASWSRSRSQTQEDLFVPNLSVATLDRVLPVVMERIRDAGLAPVFVVEELDKVAGLSSRITEMVRRLKKFVAENAFFCFLTDRTYFEEIRERTTASAYPIEYTYFTNQIFVVFRHRELHQYLDRVLEPPGTPAAGDLADPQAAPDMEAIESITDRQVLPYILLYGSQMHPIDLQRQLAAVRDARGEVQLQAGAVRSRPRYRAELMMQVAIEFVLEQEDMQAELDRDPAFLRLAIDALYYIPRHWAAADKPLHLDAAGEAAFAEYLAGRMHTDAAGDGDHAKNGGSEAQPLQNTIQMMPRPPAAPRCGVASSQVSFLMERVRDLARALTHPKALRQRAKIKELPQVVLDALPREPLLFREGREHVYRWRCYPSGRPIGEAAGAGAQAASQPNWIPVALLIDAFSEKLGLLTGGSIAPSTLSSQLGVIGTTPAWADVVRAKERLWGAQGTEEEQEGYPGRDADIAILEGFRELIHDSERAMTLALLCGTAIGSFRPNPDGRDVLPGLRAISDGLLLGEMPAADAAKELADLAVMIRDRLSVELKPPNQADLTSADALWKWAESVADACDSIRRSIVTEEAAAPNEMTKRVRLPEVAAIAWQQWFERLKSGNPQWHTPEVEDLVCMAAAAGPARYLKLDAAAMSVREWSRALAAAAVSSVNSDADFVPVWVCLAALEQLGFGKLAGERFLQALADAPTQRRRSEEEQRQLKEWKGGLPREERRLSALVVSSRDAGAVMWNDRPSSRGSAIVLDTDQALAFCKALEARANPVRDALNLDFVVFEASARTFSFGEPQANIASFFNAVFTLSESSDSQCQCLMSYSQEPPRERTQWQSVKARNLDELFTELQRLPRPPSRTTPRQPFRFHKGFAATQQA